MKDETLIHEQLNEFNTLFNNLSRINMKIDEEEETTLLSYLMLDSWDNLIMSVTRAIKLKHGFYGGIIDNR